jgi:AcrR family transcriptional regulator
VAVQAFSHDGADTSLEAIAREAGVGIGTLYRHFPTREGGGRDFDRLPNTFPTTP